MVGYIAGGVIVILFGLIALYFLRGRDRAEGTLARERVGDRLKTLMQNMKEYSTMTAEKLGETPDGKLVEAALSNLWAKMRFDLKDADEVLACLSPERNALYGAYDAVGEAKQGTLGNWLRNERAVARAVEGLRAVGAGETAALVEQAAGAEDAQPFEAPIVETFEGGEDGWTRLVAYIREHGDAFCD